MKIERTVLLSTLILVVTLSGCVEQPTGSGDPIEKYAADAVIIDNYQVSNLEPYEGALFTISFDVVHQGDLEQGATVNVDFFDINPFTVYSFKCETNSGLQTINVNSEDDVSCQIPSIEYNDAKKVSLTMKAPVDIGNIESADYTISYSITYDYVGVRKADVPIVDGVDREKPVNDFSQSEPTSGPVKVEFEPEVGSTKIEDGKVVKEYWVVEDRPYQIKLVFDHVGGNGVDTVSQIDIPGHDIELELDGNVKTSEEFAGICDFYKTSDPTTMTSKSGETIYRSKEDIVVDTTENELICFFENQWPLEDPEEIATFHVKYDYTYNFINTQTVTVKSISPGENDIPEGSPGGVWTPDQGEDGDDLAIGI